MRMALTPFMAALAVSASAASAQTWTPEQQEVWRIEEQLWKMDNAHDLSWIDTYMHPNQVGWGISEPLPRNRASSQRWDKYEYANSTVLEFELFPISITVNGPVAVVHYRYRAAAENYRHERELSTGRYTDVFVKEGMRWLLITNVGGDDPKR